MATPSLSVSQKQKEITIEAPDSHYLRAAEGWLELGNHVEANEELKQISLQSRFHPLALLVRWEIYAMANHWEFAHTIAQGIVAIAPSEPIGWINRSFALHKLHRTPEAWIKLLPAAKKFPSEPFIAYNLACYACQIGYTKEAWNWLDKALAIGQAEEIKSQALDDPDLQPLWSEIGKL